MPFEIWIAFVAASILLLIIPGPTTLLVISYGLGRGWRAALPTAIGVALGDFTALTLTLLGVGALLAKSATLFSIMKFAGAAYLIWLGIKLWRAGGSFNVQPKSDVSSSFQMISHTWLVTALNPKGILFFVAFLPQFIDPQTDFLSQVIVLVATFLVLSFANALTYGLIASRARRLVNSKKAIGNFNKAGGSLLIGAGLVTATMRGAHA